MKKNRMKFLIIEFLLLLLAVFFVWKIFDQNVAEPRIAVILPESGDKRWDALIKGMKQFAAENNVHMIICNTDEHIPVYFISCRSLWEERKIKMGRKIQ